MPTPESAAATGKAQSRIGESGPPLRSDTEQDGAASLAGKSALIVEDSWHIAIGMKCVLENAGLEVLGPAARSEAAERLLQARIPDIAVVDANLHGKLATPLVDRLRERGVPVIVVSGYEAVEAFDGKVAAFLTKPVRTDALMAALRKALDKPRPG